MTIDLSMINHALRALPLHINIYIVTILCGVAGMLSSELRSFSYGFNYYDRFSNVAGT